MIQINNLVKKFDDFTALDGVNMNVEKGAVYGLVGPNGAGKSTLIRHITGVMRQDAGEVFIDGEPVYENARIKGQMAYIPDDMFYFLQSDTINMMHYYKGMYPDFDEKQFYRMQEFFPSIDVKRNIRKLSKGMQKQVAFWLALCCKPKLIVLDEPVDGLDPVMRRQIWSIMLDDVAVNNTTVVVSSHNLRELEDVCDHVGILNKGKIMIERSLTELQGNISKIQIACPYGMPKIPQDFKVLHMSNIGRVYTVIVRGEPEAVVKAITDGKDSPQVVDVLLLLWRKYLSMRWEERTMKSKTSFINKTMLQKNVKLYWPIWTLYTIVLLLNGPFSMWSRFKSAEFIYGTNWHKYMLDIMSPAISMEADMIFIFVMALVTGMAMFSYLYNSRACNMIHAMPVTRRQLFSTNVLTGLLFMWIPQIVKYIMSFVICISYGNTKVVHIGINLLATMGISFLCTAWCVCAQ